MENADNAAADTCDISSIAELERTALIYLSTSEECFEIECIATLVAAVREVVDDTADDRDADRRNAANSPKLQRAALIRVGTGE